MGIAWAAPNIRRNSLGTRDIDVMVMDNSHTPKTIWLCNLKRNAKNHDPEDVVNEQDDFLLSLEHYGDEKKKELVEHILSAKVNRVLIFATFEDENKITRDDVDLFRAVNSARKILHNCSEKKVNPMKMDLIYQKLAGARLHWLTGLLLNVT